MRTTALLFCLLVTQVFAQPRVEFFQAVQAGDADKTQSLLRRHPEWLESHLYDNLTPLYQASHLARLEVVEVLLAQGADPNSVTGRGNTPLHAAAYRGTPTVTQALLEAGSDPDRKNSRGETPLYLAGDRNHLRTCDILLQAGADPDRGDQRGFTPLHQAAATGRLRLVKLLVGQGARINSKDKGANTPLYWCRRNRLGEWEKVSDFLEGQGAKVR